MPNAVFIFELDSGDVSVVPDLAQAAVEIEPQDVGSAVVFDQTGQQYTPVANGMKTQLKSTGDPDRDALERRLVEYVAARNVQLADATTDTVMTVADALAAQSWACRSPRWPRWLDRRLHGVDRLHYVVVGTPDPGLIRFGSPDHVTVVSAETQQSVPVPVMAVETLSVEEGPALRITGEPAWFRPEAIRDELRLVRERAAEPDLAAVDLALSEAEYACRGGTGVAVVPPPRA